MLESPGTGERPCRSSIAVSRRLSNRVNVRSSKGVGHFARGGTACEAPEAGAPAAHAAGLGVFEERSAKRRDGPKAS
jgi:hypothetical protein